MCSTQDLTGAWRVRLFLLIQPHRQSHTQRHGALLASKARDYQAADSFVPPQFEFNGRFSRIWQAKTCVCVRYLRRARCSRDLRKALSKKTPATACDARTSLRIEVVAVYVSKGSSGFAEEVQGVNLYRCSDDLADASVLPLSDPS